jgi:hypothetical protein
MIIGYLGLSSLSIGTFDICFTISIPSITCPNTTCLPSKCGHGFRVIKNCDEFVFLPQLAIDNKPAHECVRAKF